MLTGDALVEYRGHDSFVFCVDQYQHMIVSGSFDETVKLWDVSTSSTSSVLFGEDLLVLGLVNKEWEFFLTLLCAQCEDSFGGLCFDLTSAQ